jgi:predicted glycogen debranching enzyme
MDLRHEWLETDGLGGFAMGTPSGIRTRRYHGLLCAATTPPTGRTMLVNGIEAWVEIGAERFALSSHLYGADVLHPDGVERLVDFRVEPNPRWTFALPDGVRVVHELVVRRGSPLVALSWRLEGGRPGVHLEVRPLLSGRDLHALHAENEAFRFDSEAAGRRVRWQPYADLPAIVALSNGSYRAAPEWYRGFLYVAERERGFDHREDLASPGVFGFDLSSGAAWLVFSAEGAGIPPARRLEDAPASAVARNVFERERERRGRFSRALERAADAYLVTRGRGTTIVAGYPWFTDWGRDTFVALRGLCLATGRLAEARTILTEWAGQVSEGMLPNRFPDRGESAEYNSVDASLWFVVAVHELLATGSVPAGERARMESALAAILDGYASGTRYGIRCDADGLLACGVPGTQLTWMDARVGQREITPRSGKPVEVQALWINALRIGARLDPRWGELAVRAQAAFEARFWNEEQGSLFDVVDVDHVTGTVDATIRPNQILAVGGLPFALLEGARARRIVALCETRLWTPAGLRTLDPRDVRFAPAYRGGPDERDGAYHQGTVWPWLLGPFVEAWVRVHGGTRAAKELARKRFLDPLLERLGELGLGHLCEIADAEPPHEPRGCPFQAWSVGEALRLDLDVLAAGARSSMRERARAG